MDAYDFLSGVRAGLMLAQWLGNNEELLPEKEVIDLLKFKTRTMFLNTLVMCENPKLNPIIFGKQSKRLYRKSDIRELINKSQLIYNYEGVQKHKHTYR